MRGEKKKLNHSRAGGGHEEERDHCRDRGRLRAYGDKQILQKVKDKGERGRAKRFTNAMPHRYLTAGKKTGGREGGTAYVDGNVRSESLRKRCGHVGGTREREV